MFEKHGEGVGDLFNPSTIDSCFYMSFLGIDVDFIALYVCSGNIALIFSTKEAVDMFIGEVVFENCLSL